MVWVLIFGVFYPIMIIAVWCAGAFSVPLMREGWEEATIAALTKKANYNYWCNSPCHDWIWQGKKSERPTIQQLNPCHVEHRVRDWYSVPYKLKFFFGGFFWPITIPLYLAWKKGDILRQIDGKNQELTAISERILTADQNLRALETKLARRLDNVREING